MTEPDAREEEEEEGEEAHRGREGIGRIRHNPLDPFPPLSSSVSSHT
jgi:hypothetical protein